MSARTLLLIVFVASVILPASHAGAQSKQSRINDELAVQEIAPDTFVVTDTACYDSNVLVAKMPDETVLIASSPFETVSATAMVTWIQEKLAPKRIVALNTHFHADGTGGNEAFTAAGAEIWASEMTRDLHMQTADRMRTQVAAMFKDAGLRERILRRKDVPAPNVFTAKEGWRRTFGDEEVVAYYPGPAHSADNMVVVMPKRGVLFGGCMVRAAGSTALGNLGSANVDEWENSAKSLRKFEPRVVVPGHGPVGGRELIEETIVLAREARRAAAK